ncbi:DEAD/DEAH box helicase [Methanobrevibacter sp.]|uniref:DEAD/DEAH box helicase n=1 Tax=Methanobrevibacter sp. TaxID=66852 RepID=UPI002E777B58|nr:DEAD/DEAH box helicase [Methanobrevibacter sp.]MEE0940071.1 DEAD/DEAH box helicase [Methanobrevibacter sp.]
MADSDKIDMFKNDVRYRDNIAHVETIPAKKASFKKVDNLNEKIIEYLESKDMKLYEHQAETYESIKDGEHVIITTPTASGKTLAFNLPILETMIEDRDATALYIYPAKALSNDQLHVLENLEKELDLKINPRTYDGDTPRGDKRNIREKSRIVLTNPYQLHLILSWHHQWSRFYRNLRYIVIDESHYYKGVFGSNVAFLIKRLKRIANFYGSYPQFILSSATLANPLELANRLTGEEFKLVDNDTSPSGEKDFILYNPFKNYRRNKVNMHNAPSVHMETENIFMYMMLKEIQTLCFTVSRKTTELIAMWAKKDMTQVKGKLAHRIAAYRAGYRPEERREIEDGLKSGKYLGVTCTNALELGIDIGSLDAVIISGYPGTMISTWQQAGRAGRSSQKSLAVLIAFENQLDQYFMNNPKFFFDKPHENAIIDLSNPILQEAHLLCAAKELPLKYEEIEKYFQIDDDALDELISKKDLHINARGDYMYPYDDNPALDHSLDQISGEEFKIMNNGNLLETMEKSQVYREAHEGAILINKGDTYVVNSVSLSRGFVNVSQKTVDYHTMVLNQTDINIKRKLSKTKYGNLTIHFGELTVSEDYFKYKKMQFSKSVATYPLDLPPLKFNTKGLWFTIPKSVKDTLEDMFPNEEEVFAGGLHGAEHALIGLFPLHTMCDRFDIGGLSTNYHEDTQEATIFIYDGYEGGIGICEKAVDVFVDLLKSTLDLLNNCTCQSGCPACIYSPKCGNDNKPLHKNATKYILEYMCRLISDDASAVTEEVNEEIISEKVDDEQDIQFKDALELYNKNDFSQAKDILNNIISSNKNHVDSLALMAKILYLQDQSDISKMFVKRALAIDRSNEMANELDVLLNNRQHLTNEDIDVEINTIDDEEVLYEEAYDLYAQGDLDTASEILEKLLDFDSKNSEALAMMGLIYYQSGIFPKAVEYFKKAYKINKNGEMVKELKMRVC